MKRIPIILFSSFLVLLFSCTPNKQQPGYLLIHIQKPTQQPNIEPFNLYETIASSCNNACNNLHDMDCESILIGDTKVSCTRLCMDNELFGNITIHPKCIAKTTSCSEAEIAMIIGCNQ
jgi:hypothetical protein